VDNRGLICPTFSTPRLFALPPRSAATFDGWQPSAPEATVTFRVNIPALRGLPTFLDRRDHDLQQALAYLTANAVIHDNSPLYHGMFVRHRANVSAIAKFLAGAATYTSTDAGRVRTATDAYAIADGHAELRNVGRTDTAMPDFPTYQDAPPPVFDGRTELVTGAVFADTATPTSALGAVTSVGAPPHRPAWSDVLGVASVVRDGIWLATSLAASIGLLDRAYDPEQLFLTPFVGDWPGLQRSADTFANLARMLSAESTSISGAHRVVPTVWSGHASDACQCNLHNLVEALAVASAQIGALAEAYDSAAALLKSIMSAAATTFAAVMDTVTDIEMDAATIGILIPFTTPGVIVDYVEQVRSFIQLAREVAGIVHATFPPGDPLHAIMAEGTALVLPDMRGIDEQADIPLLPRPTATPTTALGVRIAA
jgi:hypothetical protein